MAHIGLRRLVERYAADAVRDGIAVHDARGRLVAWSDQAERITGWTHDEAANRLRADLPEGLVDLGDGRWVVIRHPHARRTGRRRVTMIADARREVALHSATHELKQLATTDRVTGLPNRMLLLDRLGQALSLARRERRNLAVLVVDVDGLAEAAETLGRAGGDELLGQVARRVRSRLRASDTAGRSSGTQLAVVLTTVSQPEDAELVAADLIRSLAKPFEIGARTVSLTASVGIAALPRDAADAALLLQHAEAAVAEAAAGGGNALQVFSPTMSVVAHERTSLSDSLRRALERHELVLHYQPQIDAREGRIVGVEALVRWEHPELGLLGPPTFLPLAEESGLIADIDGWVVATACGQAATWEAAGLDVGRIAVNVSGRTLERPEFVRAVTDSLATWELSPSTLEIEVTETALLHAGSQSRETLSALRGLGVGIAIDDFASGHSSLGYLKDVPVDTLKIDQSLVMGLAAEKPANRVDVAIVKSIVALAEGLGLRLVAEGVETEGQRDALKLVRCDVMQGLLLRHPIPAADLSRLLHGTSRRRLRRRLQGSPGRSTG